MLSDGKPLSEVKQSVSNLFKDKVVITVGGATDFMSLGLDPSEFEIFDLHTVFKKWNGDYNNSGEKVLQPISLRSIYYHYFKEDIQEGRHSALTDARATMKIFTDIYQKLALSKNPYTWSYELEDGEFDEIMRMK
jgi:hypothetical protein